tara:strand:+ start:28452 stop:28799 length:348 start_codon:yes stop_codon:yes gene_type:complete
MALRHWKQRFEADADLIFSKRMKLGCCGVDVVNPGDIVTEDMKAALGRNRLRLWWEAKRIELANFDGDKGRVVSVEEVEQTNLDVDHNLGGPTVDDEPVAKPKPKSKAKSKKNPF